MNLKASATRLLNLRDLPEPTGIYVRAQSPDGKWGSYDIIFLEKESLLMWLRSEEGLAEKVLLGLLGHHEGGVSR